MSRFVTTALVVALHLVLQSTAYAGTIQADRPAITEGDSWTYNADGGEQYTVTVTKVDRNSIITNNDRNGRKGSAHYTRNWNRVSWSDVRPGRTHFGVWKHPKTPLRFNFPLTQNKRWKFDYRADSSLRTVTGKSSAWVVGLELVTVPAGTFQAWKIVIESSWEAWGDIDSFGEMTETLWYVSEVKRHVKRTFYVHWFDDDRTETFELLSYRLTTNQAPRK